MNRTILVAEDERDLRDLLTIHLEENGYQVVPARDGREAFTIFRSKAVDLAVLDVMMPGMDGFTLLRKIRETSTLPVIFVTARAEEMDKVLGLGLGADDYLAKPFSMAELLARVEAQLRRSHDYATRQEAPSALLRYGELSIDKDKCCAYRAGKPLELGGKEYKLLLFFMEHPEKVFTKRQLYSAVWEGAYYDDDNTVMAHISRLRSHMEEDPGRPRYLKTIRGIGYKLHDTGEGA
jgi:DNA-binding response OmpR family regulator